MVVSWRVHTDAVIAALEGFGLTVGDATGEGLTPPYCVVYPIPGGDTYGTLADPHAHSEGIVQVTCVGESRQQAEWVADKTMGLLAGFPLTDRRVAVVSLDSNPGIQRDDDVSPPLFYSTPRFRILSTPT